MNIEKMKRSTQIAIMAGSGSTTEEKTASGTTPLTLSDSDAGHIRSIEIKGSSTISAGSIVSVGDNGLTITTTDNITTSTAVITTGLPLRSVSDSIYDTMDTEKVTKKCGKVNGSDLTWRLASEGWFYAFMPDNAPVPQTTGYDVICNKYNTYRGYAGNMPDKVITICNNSYSLSKQVDIKDTDYTDATTFAAAVADMEIVYPLATPTETPLTSAEVAALASLKTYDPTTVISVTDNPSITVKYMGKKTTRTAPKKRTSRKKKA